MTAEIAIANRHVIALAADSAVTIGSQRVWKTANKLFSLGPYNDIGIMMHGSADYLGTSWETIIKMFRSEVRTTRFSTVEECATRFKEFVFNERFRRTDNEIISITTLIVECLEDIKASVVFKTVGELSAEILKYVERARNERISAKEIPHTMTQKQFVRIFREPIRGLAKDVFGRHADRRALGELAGFIFEVATTEWESEYSSGIVVAGFGAEEVSPASYNYCFDGSIAGLRRTWLKKAENLNHEDGPTSIVLAFGQADMIYSFMEGIALRYIPFMVTYFRRMLDDKSDTLIKHFVSADQQVVETARQRTENEKIISRFIETFAEYRSDTSTAPILDVLDNLPKEEMAAMAEAMIELTSLRRRVDAGIDSVGGPVDVAIISKGDGFIWMKRKNYFDIEHNRDFLYRRYPDREANDRD